MYGEGISRVGEILDLAVDNDVVKKSGSWYSFGDRKLGQGRDATKDLLIKDTALAAEIESRVKEAMKAAEQQGSKPAGKKAADDED
jgi:recombination protein RecA